MRGSTIQTPTKHQIEWWCRATPDVARITNALCIDNRELRRLIAEYWPELSEKKRNVEGLRALIVPRVRCSSHVGLVSDDWTPDEPAEPFVVPEPSDPDGLPQ